MDLHIETFGDVQIRRRLLRFSDQIEDASPAFEEIADQLRDNERAQFADDGAHGTVGGWARLAESTIKRKRASKDLTVRANAEKILRATGATEASLTDQGAEGALEHVQPLQLTFGTTIRQARFHQPDRQGRRFLAVPERGRQDMVRTLQRFAVDLLKGD